MRGLFPFGAVVAFPELGRSDEVAEGFYAIGSLRFLVILTNSLDNQ